MTTETLTLSAFLEARIAEDEAVARANQAGGPFGLSYRRGMDGSLLVPPARVLAECKAHRAIVEGHEEASCLYCPEIPDDCDTLRALASVYADHPSWREEWAL